MKSTACALTLAAALALVAGCGGDKDSSSNNGGAATTPKIDSNALALAKGKAVFKKTCAACHGEDGKGLPHLGKDWTSSEFVKNSTDDELVAFIKKGRKIDDPMSAGEAEMPPYGGDPSLTDEQLHDVVKYIRTLH